MEKEMDLAAALRDVYGWPDPKEQDSQMDRLCDAAFGELKSAGANPQHSGFAPLLSVTALAAEKAYKGEGWSVTELIRLYADYRRIHWAVVWVDMAHCLGYGSVAGTIRRVVERVVKNADRIPA